MADFTAFSSDKFQTCAWINAALREKPEEDLLDSYLAQLAMKLHIISQDYTDQLETGMVEAMSSMPRTLTEIARLEDSLVAIDAEMQILSEQLKSFDQKNVAGVEDLSRLDTLKSNMEQCKATLAEHARWSMLVREAKSFLETGGLLTESADRIETMVKSLEILQNLPGHLERQQACHSLTESLLAAVRPLVRADVHSIDVSPLQQYLYVYAKLGRTDELDEEYVQVRPEKVRALWSTFKSSYASGDGSRDNFPAWLSSFLDSAHSFLQRETQNTIQLFGKERSPALLSTMLESIFSPLTNSMADRLHACSSPRSVSDAFVAVDEFARGALAFLDGCDSHRLSTVLAAIFGGFLIYMDSYPDAEGEGLKALLSSYVDQITFDEGESTFGDESLGLSLSDPAEVYSAFGERLVTAADASFAPTKDLIGRAARFMGGLKIKLTLRASAVSLSNFTKQLGGKVDELRVASGHPPDSSSSGGGQVVGEESTSPVALAWARRLESGELSGREIVPAALRSLQAAGRLSRRMRELDFIALDICADLSAVLFKDSFISQGLDRAVASAVSNPMAQVSSVFAAHVLHGNLSATSELKSFLAASASRHATQTVFAAVSPALSRLKSSAGALLFDLCTSAPEKYLQSLSTEDVWTKYTEEQDVDSLDSSDGFLPLSCITQVGEHVLSLMQELENFASSDALPDLLLLSGEAMSLAATSRGWRTLRDVLDASREDDGIELLCKRSSCAAATVAAERAMFGASVSISEDAQAAVVDSSADVSPDGQDDEAAAIGFVNDWLGSISDATVGQWLAELASIEVLRPAGCKQLKVDIEYFSNVYIAMGLRQHPILDHLYHLIGREPASLTAAISAVPARSSVAIALQKLDLKLIAAMSAGRVKPE